jgi:hypothetical protein
MTTHNESQGAQSGTTDDGTNDGVKPHGSMDMMDYSADELLAAITGDKTSTVTPTQAPAAQQSPNDQGAQPDADGNATKADDAAQNSQAKQAIRLRLSALPPEAQQETAEAYALVREGKAKDLFEAFAQLRGTNSAAPADPANATEHVEQTEAVNPVSALETQLKELRAERRQAKEAFEDERETELTEQIEELTGQLATERLKAELSLQQATQQHNDFEVQYQDAVSELEQSYPDVMDDNSEFTQQLQMRMDAARYRNDPALNDPRFILSQAEQVRALLEKPSGRTPPAPPASPRATGGSVAPAHNPVPRPSEDQMRMAIENASADELLMALSAKR